MDPTVLAAGAAALLGPYVRRAAEEFAGEVGRKVWAATQGLFDRLKGSFRADDEAAATLARYEQEPETTAEEFTHLLEARLRADRELAAAVAEALAEVERVGSDLKLVQRVVKAQQVMGVQAAHLDDVRSVEVDQTVEDAHTVTGIKIGD